MTTSKPDPGTAGDELALVALLAERLARGRDEYGPLRVDDDRDDLAEALEEVIDALAYVGKAILRARRLRVGRPPEPPPPAVGLEELAAAQRGDPGPRDEDLVGCEPEPDQGEPDLGAADVVVAYFGLCPRCGAEPVYAATGPADVFVCEPCRVRWTVGSGLLTAWQDEPLAEREERARRYAGFEVVEPYPDEVRP